MSSARLFDRIWIYRQIFIKFPDIRFQGNNPEWDALIRADRTTGGWTDGRTGNNKPRDYVTAPKNSVSTWHVVMYPHYTTQTYPLMFFSKIIAGLLCDSHQVQEYLGC